jgi:hypothetical protein
VLGLTRNPQIDVRRISKQLEPRIRGALSIRDNHALYDFGSLPIDPFVHWTFFPSVRGFHMNRLLNVFLQTFKICLYLRIIFHYVITYVEDLFDPRMFQSLIPI